MKRIILLFTFMLLVLLPSARAENRMLAPEDGSDYLSELFTDGETLYITGHDLYTWRAGDAALTPWQDAIELPGDSDADWRVALDDLRPFVDSGKLRGAKFEMVDDEAQALTVCDLALEDGAVRAVNVESYPLPRALRDEGVNYLRALCLRDGLACLLCQGQQGEMLFAFDPEKPKAIRVHALGWEDTALFDAPEGPVLVVGDYESPTVYRVRPDGELAELCHLPDGTHNAAVDPDTGAMFALLDGRICPVDLETGALGEAVSALPTANASGATLTDGGRCYAVILRDSLLLLDTTQPLAEGATLTLSSGFGYPWYEKALMKFQAEHPQLALAAANTPAENVLDAMLTQSTDVDVYVLQSVDGGAALDALLRRGYALPLDSSAALSDFTERLYPGIRAYVERDGHPVALPLWVSGDCIGLNPALLEAMGLDFSGVPDTWAGFLDYLENEIKPRLNALSGVGQFTYSDITCEGMQFTLKLKLLRDWQQAAGMAGVVPDYEDPRLAEALERVEAIDFTEYGLEHESPDSFGWGFSWGYGGESILLSLGLDFTFDEYDQALPGTPLALGFGDDLPGALDVRTTVAFVNPYSAHPEEAVALLEEMLAALPETTEYSLCADLTEPLPNPHYDLILEDYRSDLAEFEAQRDAAEPADRQMWEDAVTRQREAIANAGINYQWLVAPERLEWLHANADRITVAVPGWFDRDTSGEAGELMDQYLQGFISARQFLAAVNQKARMMALED